MTKRQFAIIFTLMALIVCVGVLASKLNKDGFNDPGDLGAVLQQNDDEITDEEKETLSTQDYFYNMRENKRQGGKRLEVEETYRRNFGVLRIYARLDYFV